MSRQGRFFLTPRLHLVLCARKGVDFSALGSFDIQEYKERQYDLLADAVRSGLDMELVYKILNREV